MNPHLRPLRRVWRRAQRDGRVFYHLFPWLRFGILLAWWLGTGLLFVATYNRAFPHAPLSWAKAAFAPLNMTFFQMSYSDMPPGPELDLFYLLTPLVGIPLFWSLGTRVLHVIQVFVLRAVQDQRWQEAYAATTRRHVVVCGLGRVGYRVAQQLQQLGEPLVGIEDVDSPLVRELMEADMPVILGDIREDSVLRKAHLAAAKAVIICTNNDHVNLRAAFRVRDLHPGTPIVLRLFDDELSAEIHTHLALDAILSRSAIAALSLAHAAVGVEVLESFTLHGQEYALARLPLGQACSLAGCTVAHLEEWRDVRLVGLSRGEQLLLEPAGAELLREEDVLLIFAATPRLMALVQAGAGEALPPVLVCGLGHTGYRVALALRELGQEVVALAEENSPLAARLERHGVAVRRGDWGDAEVLRAAGVERAAAIVLCAEDDMLNLETALRARRLNPALRVVLRAFYEDWGEQLRRAFGFQAVYSTSALAAPHFVAAALRRLHVASEPIRVGGQELYPARIKVEPASFLLNRTIADLDRDSGLIVLLHRHEEQMQLPPQPQARLLWGDEVVVLATTARLRALNLAHDPRAEP